MIQGLIDLVEWRRGVGDLYRIGGADTITEFRRRRDELFKSHSQSPIEPDERSIFTGLEYFSPDPAYRVTATLEAIARAGELIKLMSGSRVAATQDVL